jgi:hypothetical protein
MLKRFSVLLALPLLAGTLSIAHAEDISNARWFRYYDDKHQPTVTDSITPEHVARGYDALTANMQLIKHVNPQRALSPEELAAVRAKRDADAQRAKDDKQLLRLYSGPLDAEHARDRQLDAIQLRIDFSNNALASMRQRRAAEAQRAAVFERTGKPVPADLKQSIASYDQQITAAQNEIAQRKADQEKVRAEFAPVVARLQELTGKPASSAPAQAAPAKPAVPGKP